MAFAMLVESSVGIESADAPSPRTSYSVHNPHEMKQWSATHARLVADAQSYVPAVATRLVCFGDSITESWRGTAYGRAMPRAQGVPAVLNATFGRWSPLALGIAADCTQHLLWRMMNGEVSP